ncbi:hypothetical protein AB2T96_18680 [Clostridium butyricum]|uniref:hypothetical protein n=1 Tax=Clostridium butyricum TaxID=1492 RepID=UPI0034672BB0
MDKILELEKKIADLEDQVQNQQKEFYKALAFLFDRSEYKELIKQGKCDYPKMLTDALKQTFNILSKDTSMNNKQAIEQLKDLKKDRESFLTKDADEVYTKDIEAIDIAIRTLERTAQEVPVQEQLTKKDIECIYRHLQMFIQRENKYNVPDACEVCNSHCSNEEHILNQWDSFDKLSNLIIQYGLDGESK